VLKLTQEPKQRLVLKFAHHGRLIVEGMSWGLAREAADNRVRETLDALAAQAEAVAAEAALPGAILEFVVRRTKALRGGRPAGDV
jgi:hypothetical protein